MVCIDLGACIFGVMHPKNLHISKFTYDLPEEFIPKYPLAERDSSKLLVYENGEITLDVYQNIDRHIPGDSLLVFNNTKVVEARILFQKPTGGVIEIFCLEPHTSADISTAMLQKEKVLWRCLVGGASKWKPGQILEKKIELNGEIIILHAAIADRLPDCFVIELTWEPISLTFAEILHAAGLIPLPPYLHRPAEEKDKETYQTVYAANDGSVAAPTAGLHFTENIFQKLAEKNIEKAFLTLHVGAGTFKPVKSESIGDHVMHAEFFEVKISTLKSLVTSLDKGIVAVGTTSLRTLESLYWLGVKVKLNAPVDNEMFELDQWYPYEAATQILPAKTALQNLIKWLEEEQMTKLIGTTQIMIAPGYKFRIVKGIITNFHQPQSTLLLLIAALVGDDWKKIYEYAKQNNFRFLSYGDGSLLWAKA